MKPHILDTLHQARSALDALLANPAALAAIGDAGDALVNAFRQGKRVFSCGNGGSMCDAMHFAEELSGRYRLNRKALPAASISDPSHISCVGNDYGYEAIFSRYLEAHAGQGDVLLAISTSGSSKNILAAVNAAKALGVTVVALTGRPGSVIGELADIDVCTPGGQYADRVQELHIKVIHILIESVERELFPENYA
ncbi:MULTISPECIES: SIS domain-containing protein [Vogesella]|uniref:SIS domain-containing protein n=1 Tax=Vogesella indigofera TaxID=45465 RepID=A0ABT5I5G3_VOGIN|nr:MULTISPECIES: SIS domain-containing protein [Vogesella]MCQ4145768.1 SIS domain-containing protein [Vogesella sp. AC12]MDC7690731.1 SIS domain-containing protein [Vogesella indigofera]MDC7705585.1 SIS domain-containing protein [Vogesella indigofera]